MPHVVWDWNGTLIDDLEIVVGAVNASLDLFGAPRITADAYRDHYVRPVKVFYERLLEREITDEEWLRVDSRFHEVYRSSLDQARLADGACAAMGALQDAGHTQSVLSMWWHHELVPMVERLGVTPYMVTIQGNTADAGAPKAMHLADHLGRLDGAIAGPGRDVIMIGDSLDDGVAARENGIWCVMYDSGSHHRRELVSTGFPVADSLARALALAGLP